MQEIKKSRSSSGSRLTTTLGQRAFISAARLSIVLIQNLRPFSFASLPFSKFAIIGCMQFVQTHPLHFIDDHNAVGILQINLIRLRRRCSIRLTENAYDGAINRKRIIERHHRNLP